MEETIVTQGYHPHCAIQDVNPPLPSRETLDAAFALKVDSYYRKPGNSARTTHSRKEVNFLGQRFMEVN